MKDETYRILYDRIKHLECLRSKYVIDIGCRDISTSNVRPFIEEDCRALLIEPNPTQVKVIEKEIESYKEFNTGYDYCKVIPVAIGEVEKEVDFIVSPNIGHSRIPNANFNRNKWQTKGEEKIKVMQYPLQIILNSHREFEDADIVDIDCEGYDTEVLKSLLDSNCTPEFILIEHWGDSKIFSEQWELFTKHHYTEIGIDLNQSSLWHLLL